MNLDWIRQGLKRPGKSQDGLAAALGVHPAQISRLLAGTRRLRVDELAAISAYLGVTPETGAPLASPMSTDDDGAALDPAHLNTGRRATAPTFGDLTRDLPVRGVAIGGEHGRGDFRFNGEVVDHLRRPPRLGGAKDAFVIYLTGDSMFPRFKEGAPVYIHPGQPPRVGDDVLVELHPEREGEAGAAMVKILVARTSTKLKLAQYNPATTKIELDMRKVKNVFRVVPYEELLNF